MSAEPNPIIEVRGLADALFDGNLDAAGVARLESLIDNSTACLNAYVERIDLHGELLDQADPHSNAQAALMVLTDFTDACTARAARNAYRLYAFSAAATLAVCCLTGWLFWSDILKPVPLGSIAHMTSDTRASSGTLELGQVVRAGSTLSVKSGVLSIELPHVMLDLLGPARLKLNDLHRVELQKGTLTVRVGPGGEGFTVRTADAEVVDFGTEFSVKYDSGQGTAVSVRHGRVRSSLLDHENVSSKVLELTANRAARLQRGTATLSEVVFQPEAFEQVDRARGKIHSLTGQIRTTTNTPASLLSEQTTTPNHILVLPEQQNVILQADLVIDTLKGQVRLPAGAVVSSYLVHYDPTTSAAYAPRGAIKFSGTIAGAIVNTEALLQTDSLFGIPDLPYEVRPSRGLELQDDLVQMSEDQQTISFFFRMSPPEYQDQVRVLVYSE